MKERSDYWQLPTINMGKWRFIPVQNANPRKTHPHNSSFFDHLAKYKALETSGFQGL